MRHGVYALRFVAVLSIGMMVCLDVIGAQAPSGQAAAPRRTFEVASVKENVTGGGESLTWPPSGLKVSNMRLRSLIMFAYDITDPAWLIGVPGWVQTKRFDVDASYGDRPETKDENRKASLQHLLQTRFGLVLTPISRDQDAYALTVVTPSLGDSLRVSATECGPDEGGRGTPKQGPTCPLRVDRARGTLSATATLIDDLANHLTLIVGRPVLDRTRLTERYDATLNWNPDAGGLAAVDAANPYPSIFTAVQEQLGLRLVPTKAPANAFSIQSIESLRPN